MNVDNASMDGTLRRVIQSALDVAMDVRHVIGTNALNVFLKTTCLDTLIFRIAFRTCHTLEIFRIMFKVQTQLEGYQFLKIKRSLNNALILSFTTRW